MINYKFTAWFLAIIYIQGFQCFAQEEGLFGPEYQTYSEQEQVGDSFTLFLGIGYGLSVAKTMAIDYANFGRFVEGGNSIDPSVLTFLDQLDVDFSENIFSGKWSAIYSANPKLGFYGILPFGLIRKLPDQSRLPSAVELEDYKIGVGDLSAGMYYHVFAETRHFPDIYVQFDIDSPTANAISLGDGLWGYTGAFRFRKFLRESAYLTTSSGYTYRQKKNGILPGHNIAFSGGLGFLMAEKSRRLDIDLKYTRTAEARFHGGVLLSDYDNLILTINLSSVLDRFNLYSYISGFDDGIDIKADTFGVGSTWSILNR